MTKMQIQDIGVAMIGAGFIGPVHVEALKRVGVKIVGILGVDEAESKRAAAALGLPRAYATLEEVLSDPAVHSVHIATPNRLHFQMAKAALEAGKHVLCEKPLSMTSEESAELVAFAKTKPNLAAGVNYNVRYYPLALHAKELRKSGALGEVFHVTGSYVQDWLFFQTDYNWRVLAAEGGELRAVSDIGTHWLDLIHNISGLEVTSVFADLATVWPVRKRPKGEVETFSGKVLTEDQLEPVDITTDDYGSILLRFSNGGKGSFHVSQVTAGRKNRLCFEMAGSNQALAFASQSPNEMWIGHRNEPNQTILKDPGLVAPAVKPYVAFPGGHNEGFPDTMKQCFRAFYTYIAAGDFSAEPTFPTFEEGHREIVLCEAILQSHREQRWVDVQV